jgi:hypothetical protein
MAHLIDCCSINVWNVLWWRLNWTGIAVVARRSALPRLCGFYLTCRAANAIPSNNLFSEAVDAPSDNGSAPLTLDTTGRICVEVALIDALSPAIAVILILAVGNLGAGHAPAKRGCHSDQGSRETFSFGPAQHGSLPVYAGDTNRHRPILVERVVRHP